MDFPLLLALRAATAPSHARLETLLPLQDPALDRDSYRRSLIALARVVPPLEARIGPALSPRLRDGLLAPRRKAALLRADLACLGADPSPPALEPLPELRGQAGALGAMYVIEGATLGGATLVRRVSRTLGLSPRAGCAYLHSYGEQRGAMWRAFLATLAAECAPGEHAEAVAAAVATFDAFERSAAPAVA